MKSTLALVLAAVSWIAQAQHPAEASLEKNTNTLEERYFIMKNKSETFNEYKVIKEYILDGMWKLTQDSIQHQQALLQQAREEITQLKSQVAATAAALQLKEDSMEEVVHASTHINVLGISFGKNAFLGLVAAIMGGLVLVIALVTGRMKLVYTSLKEKMDLEHSLSREFENYKRNALEKQMKLSRELQDERNRLEEMRSLSAG